MQRHAMRAAQQALRSTARAEAPTVAWRAAACGAASAGPSRLFSTSPALGKKAKVSAALPPKGKARAEDDPSETDVKTQQVLAKTKEKMEKAVNYAKGLVYDGVERGRGKVSPALLDNIRVQLPNEPSASTLNSIASVTVKQNTLFVEIWDTAAMKHVESAIHKANLPGLSPQRVDQTTIKIPVSRPTVEQRTLILRNLHNAIEGAKQQVRTARADGIKLVGGKGFQGANEVQDLANDYGGQLDELEAQAKKEFGK